MRHLSRWQGATVGSLLLIGLGIVFGFETMVLIALVAICVVVLVELSPGPTAAYSVERTLSTDRPTPGTPVTVTLTIENESARMLSDLRIIEDIPADVTVVSGTPSFATSVPPGGQTTHTYEFIAPRGTFAFGDLTVRQRNLAATIGRVDAVTPSGTIEFTCETLIDQLPLRRETIQYFGETATNDGGSGLEFHSVREYRPGDPIGRIDWNQYARSGTLSTVDYRVEQSVSVVFLIDDRIGGHVEAIGGGPNSFDLTLYAASKGIAASLERGNRTGVATVAGEWVDPGADEYTQSQINDVIEETRTVATDGGVDELLAMIPSNGQIVVCSPLVDDGIVDLIQQCDSNGIATSVVSPDMTTGLAVDELTVGNRLAGVRRQGRIATIRRLQIPVADWNLREPVMIELQRLQRRWSR